jgi:hypothetical protein
MIKKTFEGRGEFLFITVPKGAKGFVVDNAMQYFIFKLVNEKAYKKAEGAADVEYLTETFIDPEEFTGNGGCKLPEGNFEVVGLAFRLEQSKVDLIGYSNFIVTMIKEKLIAKQTFILKRVN